MKRFLFLGSYETLVCDTPIENAEDQVARIVEIPEKFEICLEYFRIFKYPRRRCVMSTVAGGKKFYHFLWPMNVLLFYTHY